MSRGQCMIKRQLYSRPFTLREADSASSIYRLESSLTSFYIVLLSKTPRLHLLKACLSPAPNGNLLDDSYLPRSLLHCASVLLDLDTAFLRVLVGRILVRRPPDLFLRPCYSKPHLSWSNWNSLHKPQYRRSQMSAAPEKVDNVPTSSWQQANLAPRNAWGGLPNMLNSPMQF